MLEKRRRGYKNYIRLDQKIKIKSETYQSAFLGHRRSWQSFLTMNRDQIIIIELCKPRKMSSPARQRPPSPMGKAPPQPKQGGKAKAPPPPKQGAGRPKAKGRAKAKAGHAKAKAAPVQKGTHVRIERVKEDRDKTISYYGIKSETNPLSIDIGYDRHI